MQDSDVDGVYAIELAAHRAPWSRDIFSDCLLVGYDCRVLEVDSKEGVELAGYIICRYHVNTCHILNLCVAPHLQGRGYGKILLQDILKHRERKNIEVIVLEVRPSNTAALHLYKKMGFQQIGIKRDYYQDEEGIEDAVVLQKRCD
jgi:ribosomal-protein-alanine N-acetyltransferase